MCTALTYKTKDFYFGRNLDYEHGYGQSIIVVPRNYPIPFRHMKDLDHHYALIGMGIMTAGYPNHFEAMNEKGLAMAGLNFVGNAVYHPLDASKDNVAQFELTNYILCTCANIAEAKEALKNLNVDNEKFSDQMPDAYLHWMIADENGCIVVESMKDGLHVHENPYGVLTNNPPFEIQSFLLNQYMSLSAQQPANTFSKEFDLHTYSRGMGGLGLPGDLSSSSRFAKCVFTRTNSTKEESEEASVSQFFHISHSVEQQKGCCEVREGDYEYTIYSSCMNTNKGIYYYTTYNDATIHAIDMHRCNLDGNEIVSYPFMDEAIIEYQN